MRLYSGALATAVSAVWAIMFVICAALVAIWPAETTAFFGSMLHTELSSMEQTLTWGNFFSGLICSTAIVWLAVWFSAVFYNGIITEAPDKQSVGGLKPGPLPR